MNEEFDKWWKESVYMDGDCAYDAAKAAYLAGAAAMRDKCAYLPEIMAECMLDGSGKMIVSGIAAAIRKIGT